MKVVITKCVRYFITMRQFYYKMRQLLQNMTVHRFLFSVSAVNIQQQLYPIMPLQKLILKEKSTTAAFPMQ